jgi:hypothetical protein
VNRPAASGTAFAVLCCVAAAAGAVDFSVTMAEVARNPADYVGQRVVISDCLMISFSTILGAQCSIEPIDAAVVVYVDADDLSAAEKRLADACSTTDVNRMCVLKVSGEVTLNYRYQPVLMKAKLELVRRPAAI